MTTGSSTGPRAARPMKAVIDVATPVIVRTPLGTSSMYTPGKVGETGTDVLLSDRPLDRGHVRRREESRLRLIEFHGSRVGSTNARWSRCRRMSEAGVSCRRARAQV